jgi:hypothetical protein
MTQYLPLGRPIVPMSTMGWDSFGEGEILVRGIVEGAGVEPFPR